MISGPLAIYVQSCQGAAASRFALEDDSMEAMVALTSGSSYLSVSLEMQFPSIKDSDAAPIQFITPHFVGDYISQEV